MCAALPASHSGSTCLHTVCKKLQCSSQGWRLCAVCAHSQAQSSAQVHAGTATAALGELEKLRAATLDSLNSPSPPPALAARGNDAREAAELREQLAAAEAALRAAQAQAAQPNGARALCLL